MKKIIILMMLLMAASLHAASLMSEQAFTQRYAKEVQKLADGITTEIRAPLEVVVKSKQGGEFISYLDNAYADYANSPDELNDVLATYTSSLKKLLDNKPLRHTKEQLVPVIKDYLYIEQILKIQNEQGKDDKFPFVTEKLNDVLFIVYAFDSETSISFAREDDIKELGLKKSVLKKLAKDNLKRKLPKIQIEGDPAMASILVVDGVYEASLLLYDNIWTKKNFPVQGDIVVYVPARDMLLVTGSGDNEGLKKVKEIVHDPEAKWSHVISDAGFIRKGDQWQVFNP